MKFPLSGPDGIVQLMQRSCLEPSQLKVGIEVERIGLYADKVAMAYEDRSKDKPGAQTLLEHLKGHNGWECKFSPDRKILGYSTPDGTLSLEPGSQLEFSARPVRTLQEMEKLLTNMESIIDGVTRPWGVEWVGLGVSPQSRIEDQDIIPLPRYHLMNDYFGKSGTLGRAMMRLTSSLQFNFDYCSEASAVRLFQASMAAVPISYALFSNSPWYEGKKSPFLSFRSEIWRNTDPARSGLLPMVFEKSFGFKKYADYIWQLPLMYCQDETGEILPANGLSLEKLSKKAIQRVCACSNNLRLALAQVFTEARWKTGFLEVRSVDGLGPEYRLGAAAFWTGLMYDAPTCEWITEKLGHALSVPQREALWVESCKWGLSTEYNGISLAKITEELFDKVHVSLVKRGNGEEKYLAAVKDIIEKRENPAQRLLKKA